MAQQPGPTDLKTVMHDQLRAQRAALLAKLDGLAEREARLPRTPTGTNLLGLVKHVACCEAGYFGEVFDRPIGVPMPWDEPGIDEGDNHDMFAVETEAMADVLTFAETCFRHADTTIEELPLDAPGAVPWWPVERRRVTLGQVLNHMALDSARHAGQADIMRELHDGVVGLRSPGSNLPDWDAERWQAHRDRLQRIAESR